MSDDPPGSHPTAPSSAEAPPLSPKERTKLRRARGTRLPLVLVLLSLAFAILLPRVTQRRITRLPRRHDVITSC